MSAPRGSGRGGGVSRRAAIGPTWAAAAVLAAVLARGPQAGARRVFVPPPPADIPGEVAAAIRARDPARVAALLAPVVDSSGLWLTDAACAREHAGARRYEGAALADLARCLARLDLWATTRQPGAPSRGVLTVAPGIELELGVEAGRVTWLGYAGAQAADQARPALAVQVLEGLRAAGSIRLDDALRASLDPVLDRARAPQLSAWVKLCLDPQGAIDRVAVIASTARSTDAAAVAAAIEPAVRAWRFRPFRAGGRAHAPCALVLITYPAARAPLVETLPALPRPPPPAREAGGPPREGGDASRAARPPRAPPRARGTP